MKRLKSDDDGVDRVSELPESLIFQILSFLEMRDVVRTSLLSKHWKDLWTTIPYLRFDESGNNSDQTRNFINRALLRWKGIKIKRFIISFGGIYDASLSSDMDFWIRFATERKVEVLCIRLPYHYLDPLESFPAYLPPYCLYSCSSIKALWLIGFNLHVNVNLQWNQLKIVRIHCFCMSEDVINRLVSSAPRLESLSVRLFGSGQNLSIQSTSLKRLTLVNYCSSVRSDNYDPSNYTSLTIWTPNLQVLSISGVPYSKCLMMDVSSLSAANLRFNDRCNAAVGETLKQFLPAIQHVEALTLSVCCFKMLAVMKDKYSFWNVKILNLRGGPIEPCDIVGLAGYFPKVEKLVIDCPKPFSLYGLFIRNLPQKVDDVEDHYNKVIKSLVMQLRTVEVTWYSYHIFQFIKFLLKHATMEQKIVIKQGRNGVVESEEAAQELLSLQTSFPALDLIFCKK
ncbi:hypothetical protein C2S51_027575 [Perilla frutescens var. frutescens]|nr:hypothetical protein C2S51_027575 [Perilla frutescens var. frutescens]